MSPFQPATLPPITADELMARYGLTREQAEAQIKAAKDQMVLMNDTHQVNVSKLRAPFGEHNGDMAWLSIKRRDKSPVHDWRELQAIKNAVIGPEHEGVELYPAESRMVDTANQYHLFVFLEPTVRMPFGYLQREVMTHEQAAACGAVQRPLGAGADNPATLPASVEALRELLACMEDDEAKGTADWCARAERAMDAARAIVSAADATILP